MTQETDCELLGLAAKAIHLPENYANEAYMRGWYMNWHPETDDGDCARLEAALSIDVSWGCGFVTSKPISGIRGFSEVYSDHGDDRQAARRMATLKAAAEIGRVMP